MALGLMFFCIFGFYGYSFFWGGYLRYNGVKNGDREYTGGVVIAIMFSVVFGAFGLGGASPNIHSIAEGRIAGKLAFGVIDHKPKIIACEKDKKILKRDEISGKIELKNINFTYPSRQELQVLKDFSVVFEAGKTTALVGPSGSGKSTII